MTEPPHSDPGSPQQPYAQPPVATTAPTETLAIWALVCAIGSWLVLPVVLAVVALVLASQADRTIDASAGSKSGKGMVAAARVIAWVHLALTGLFLIFIIAFAIGLVLSN